MERGADPKRARPIDSAERRYTVNGTLSLAEGKIEITRKIVASMAGVLVVSGGRFFVQAAGVRQELRARSGQLHA